MPKNASSFTNTMLFLSVLSMQQQVPLIKCTLFGKAIPLIRLKFDTSSFHLAG